MTANRSRMSSRLAGGGCNIFDDGMDGGFSLSGCCRSVSATVNIPEDGIYEIRGYVREGIGGYYMSTAHQPGRHTIPDGINVPDAFPIGFPKDRQFLES